MRTWLISLLIFSTFLYGHPTGMEVLKGTADLKQIENGLFINVSNGAILTWQDFSISSGQLVQFIQPNGNSWVLNRVTGKIPSAIYGELKSNGQLVLINPNGILFAKDSVIEVGGIIASSLKDITLDGTIEATNGAIALLGKEVQVSGTILSRVGKNAYVRTEENPYGIEIKKVGGKVFLWSDEKTSVTNKGHIEGDNVILLSEGITDFQGTANVGDIEISGRQGFYHGGEIERTGHLLLDPEADVTISTMPSYNNAIGEGPTSDLSNISIDKLIEEIQKGPVTITTSYQGEGGTEGSITVMADVNHTFESPHPLIFQTAGGGGIHVEGSLTNTGNGIIELTAPFATIDGKLIGHDIRINGDLFCSGELFATHITLLSKGNSEITGKIITDGGDFYWRTSGDIRFIRGEWGHLGEGSFQIDGVRDFFIEEGAHLYATSEAREMIIKNLSGTFSIEKGRVSAGGAPLFITGKEGAVSLDHGSLSSSAPIRIDVGRHVHLNESDLFSEKLVELNVGSDLLLMGKSRLHSPAAVRVNAAGNLIIMDTSSITGRGLSLIAGENLFLLNDASFNSRSGPLSLSVGKEAFLSGNNANIRGGRVIIHAGESLTLEEHASISSSSGSLSITAGHLMRLDDRSFLTASGGNLDLIVTGGNLHLYGASSLNSTTHGTNIITGKSLIMEDFSHIETTGEGGTTIVVDNLGGKGGLILGRHASITTGTAPLQIFSSKREFNTIEGTLNGVRYIETPLYLNTVQERWGSEYLHPLSMATHFTFFYKELGQIQINNGMVNQADFSRILINYIGPFTAELQRTLHPYDEFTTKAIRFTIGTPENPQENRSFIRRSAFRHNTSPTLYYKGEVSD